MEGSGALVQPVKRMVAPTTAGRNASFRIGRAELTKRRSDFKIHLHWRAGSSNVFSSANAVGWSSCFSMFSAPISLKAELQRVCPLNQKTLQGVVEFRCGRESPGFEVRTPLRSWPLSHLSGQGPKRVWPFGIRSSFGVRKFGFRNSECNHGWRTR